MMLSRRSLLPLCGAPLLRARVKTRVKSFELIPVRATERTVWLFVRVHGSDGLSGLGEASDAFGFQGTSRENAARMESEMRALFSGVEGRSPLEIEAFRQRSWPLIQKGGLVAATAFSALEQALWDLAGQALGEPAHALLGGAVRTRLPLYANINRSVRRRVPEGFAAAARGAVAAGFRHVKLAPFDGFPPLRDAARVKAALDNGVACVEAVRREVGAGIGVMIDCHSFFPVPMAIETAERLRPLNLSWYEEPVAPEKTAETLAIRRAIPQPMAGGEMLFAMAGFRALCETKAVDVIMPDVKHCGGLLELTRIAAFAAMHGVEVSPHNPAGPVSTAAAVQVCAGLANFRLLELQVGEAEWRGEALEPAERVVDGALVVPERPGFGCRLRMSVVARHRA